MSRRTSQQRTRADRLGSTGDASNRSANRDERHARIAIHLQRAATDLKAAERELRNLTGPERADAAPGIRLLAQTGRNLRVIHNHYSPVKMP